MSTASTSPPPVSLQDTRWTAHLLQRAPRCHHSGHSDWHQRRQLSTGEVTMATGGSLGAKTAQKMSHLLIRLGSAFPSFVRFFSRHPFVSETAAVIAFAIDKADFYFLRFGSQLYLTHSASSLINTKSCDARPTVQPACEQLQLTVCVCMRQ